MSASEPNMQRYMDKHVYFWNALQNSLKCDTGQGIYGMKSIGLILMKHNNAVNGVKRNVNREASVLLECNDRSER